MTEILRINGSTPTNHPHVNGVNGVNGVLPKDQQQAYNTIPILESDLRPEYLEGWTFEDIIKAHPISDPYEGIMLPGFARPAAIDLSSFKPGHTPTADDFAAELRTTFEGQIPLADILDRLVQDAYHRLNELAELMPSYGDRERKVQIIQYAVQMRKQIVKVYAISKWARVADDVQKALNLLSFLTRSESKVFSAKNVLRSTAAVLVPQKRRNSDLTTALDVLVNGTYTRLPGVLKEWYEDRKPITNAEIIETFAALDESISYRLRIREILPVAIKNYTVAEGRVHLAVPNQFEATLSITGPEETDYWYALDMKFLHDVGGDDPEIASDFPSDPHPWLKTQIIHNLNFQLAMNSDPQLDKGDPSEEAPKRERRDPLRIDAPLVRAFNMLQMLALSYQLEILYHQAVRMLKLGWQDFISLSMELPARRSFSLTYWKRPPTASATHPQSSQRPDPVPPHGGVITFSIVTSPPPSSPSSASKAHVNRVLSLLEQTVKTKPSDPVLPVKEPSDRTEVAQLRVEWRPVVNALLIPVPQDELTCDLAVDPTNVDFGSILRTVTRIHARAILQSIRTALLKPGQRSIFAHPADVELIDDDATGCSLRVHLCGSQAVVVYIDERTGRIVLKDVGVFAASNRSGRLLAYAMHVNKYPYSLLVVIRSVKFEMIFAEIENQARYLGLQTTRHLAIPPSVSIKKFGKISMAIYIHLASFTDYYLTMLATEDELKWALVNVKDVVMDQYRMRNIEDFCYLDADRIGGAKLKERRWAMLAGNIFDRSSDAFNVFRSEAPQHLSISTETIRELYAFCCARVSHMKVEQQLKTRGIPWTSVFSSYSTEDSLVPSMGPTAVALTPFSPSALSVPNICIHISNVVKSHAAKDVAYENVRMKVIDWWSEASCRVVTSVRLRDIQPISGAAAALSSDKKSVATSRRITYDPATSIVSFLSNDITTCVDEFVDEWERVQRVASIVREVGQARVRRKWSDIRILDFDLQRVQFVYHKNYSVAIQWIQASLTDDGAQGLYETEFTVLGDENAENPHQDVAVYLCRQLQEMAAESVEQAVDSLILTLRDSLPVLLALQDVRQKFQRTATLLTKSSSSYRLIFERKYALDFRILGGGRLAITDPSVSLFIPRKVGDVASSSFFVPITGFQTIAEGIIGQCKADPGSSHPPIASVDNGLVCSSSVVDQVVSRLCQEVMGTIANPSGAAP